MVGQKLSRGDVETMLVDLRASFTSQISDLTKRIAEFKPQPTVNEIDLVEFKEASIKIDMV
jgi:hypothetical protein